MQGHPNTTAVPVPSTNAAASGSDSVLEVSADADHYWVLQWISWSYDAVPASGNITVQSNGATVAQFDITSSGPGIKHFSTPGCKGLYIGKNKTLNVTLADGTCNSKLNIQYL